MCVSRNLLQREQSFSSQGRQVEEMELVIQELRGEKALLSQELKSSKEKLLSCEKLIQRIQRKESASQPDESPDIVQNQAGLFDCHTRNLNSVRGGRHGCDEIMFFQVDSLIKQVATLETRELNEKQRADHNDSRCRLLQAQVAQLEKRNEEVEAKFAEVSKSNLDLEKTERELRDQGATSTPKSALDQLASNLKVRSLVRVRIQAKSKC